MRPAKPRDRAATIVQILEYMDGPQAALLSRDTGTPDCRIVAVAINKDGYERPFFGAAISLDQWERYRRGFVDLRFLFMYPRWKDWYIFDLKSGLKVIALTKIVKDAYAEEHYIPDAGFFSYDHSEQIKSTETAGLATQKYNTDGIWDFADFSQFYNKVTDLYSFYLSLKKYVSSNTASSLKRQIQESFGGQPLRGGSSYVNLYTGLLSIQKLGDRLSIGKLRYASPGEVDVKGRLDIFAEMAACLGEFTANYDSIREQYNERYSYLAKSKLLKIEPDEFDNDGATAEFLKKEGDDFAKILGIEKPELIYELTGNHSLRYVKVLLAHFRRLEGYFMFFAEGRVKDPQTIEPN